MTKVVETHTQKNKLKNSALSPSMDQQYWTIFSTTTNSVKVSRKNYIQNHEEDSYDVLTTNNNPF